MTTGSLSGRRVGGFDVGPLVGAGGMGEVYRGRDVKLNREVAIKVLLPAVAGDAERLARFSREAQVLASISHPNIAQIHGVVEADSGPLLILEFVEGPTLADRIAQGPLPIDESIAIATQIADALEAAHERGVIHRDLKPANIKVDDHGTVKVLDFGLAKAVDQGSGIGDPGSGSANSPTITTPAMTQAGVILGTAAYMSPEQAKGRAVDKRSDVWAFGCVLFEMLTGTRAFGGEDVTDTIAAVVRGEPQWAKLPAATPPHIRLLLTRCLEKDRKARIADVSVARFLIDEKVGAVAPPAKSTASPAMVTAAAAVVVAVIGAAAWTLRPGPVPGAPRPVRFELPLRALPASGGPFAALSRDGSFVVYIGGERNNARGLMVRELNELEPRQLVNSSEAPPRAPFVSPDGQWVGFFGVELMRKVRITGDSAEAFGRFNGEPRGASWGDDGQIVFAASRTPGLQRVSAAGGEPTALTSPPERGESDIWPHVLPGSHWVVFTTIAPGPRMRLEAVEVATGARKTLLPNAYGGQYISTGHLVFGVGTSPAESRSESREVLKAVRFDPVRAEILGEPVTMIDPLTEDGGAGLTFSVSGRGDLLQVQGGSAALSARSLVWVDRQGQETAIPAPARAYATARLSPDGARIALDVRETSGGDIWIWDFARQTLTPVSLDRAIDQSPIWTPDGQRVIWSSSRDGAAPSLFWQAADGSGRSEPLTQARRVQIPTSVSPDGRHVLFFGPGAAMDIQSVTLDDPQRPTRPVLETPASEGGGEVSPDGRWIAFMSNEAGQNEVYVRPFPNVQEGRWQVSNTGGTRPVWSRDGRELFYVDQESRLTAIPVQSVAGKFAAGPPVNILKDSYFMGRTTLGLILRSYDVAPDGRRFLMIKEPSQSVDAVPPRMVVMLDWAQELKARLPR